MSMNKLKLCDKIDGDLSTELHLATELFLLSEKISKLKKQKTESEA